MQFIDPAHRRQVGIRDGLGQVTDRSQTDAGQIGLTGDGARMAMVDRGFAVSNPAACSGTRLTGAVTAVAAQKTSAARSSNCFFHSAIWLGCNSNSRHNLAVVRSSCSAA